MSADIKKFPWDFLQCIKGGGDSSFLQTSDFGYLSQRLAYNSASADIVEYVGYANPGAGISASGWAIKQMLYTDSSAGALLNTVGWAGSSNSFNRMWDDRSTYVYG